MNRRHEPMKISTRFLILVGVLFIVTGATEVALVNQQMGRQALLEAESKALSTLDHYFAIHTYFSQQLRPRLLELTEPIRKEEYFDTTWMSSTYAIQEINEYCQSSGTTGKYYKECSVNACSPGNEATDFEKTFLEELDKDPELMVASGKRSFQGKDYFVALRRGKVKEKSYLRRDSNPDGAPRDLVRFNGPERGFHRKAGDVVQTISIRVPLSVAYAEANRFSFRLSAMLLVLFMLIFGVIYCVSRQWIFQPLEKIRKKALMISENSEHLGEEIPLPSGRELYDLTASFNRMSDSLRQRRDHSEDLIKDRAGELTKATEELQEEVGERKQAQADSKRGEEALRVSEQKYRLLVEHANDAILVVQDEVIKFPNPVVMKLTGYSEEELIAIPFMNLIHPGDREMVLERYRKRLMGEGVPSLYAFRVIDKEGRESWVQLNAVRIMWEGRPATLNFLRDITAHRTLEVQLQQSQKMEALGTLAGGLAHDLNNLMTVVMGYSNLLLKVFVEDKVVTKDLEEIHKAGERAADLVSQLLAFTRRQVLKPVRMDLNGVVKDMYGMLRRLIGEDVDLQTVLSAGLDQVKADPSQIEQVIMNLVVNARDAMSHGGKLTIETNNITLDEAYGLGRGVQILAGPYVMVSVCDTGIGMDKETQSHIFEPFFTTKEKGKGTGLGLSTVYGIVKQHGGYVWAYSELGEGTTFKVYLPRAEGAPDVASVKQVPEGVLQGAETILVVEDEEVVMRLARKVLEGYGYTVLAGGSGEEALEICMRDTHPIHLMLTDVVMPGLSGRQLAERVKTHRADMKVLYMSGYTDNAIVQHGVLEKGVNFIEKPFTPKSLARKVRQVLDKKD